MKKILCILCAVLLLSVTAFALPKPTNEFYVNDFANVLDGETEKHIVNVSSQIAKETGAQIVVVTVETLEGMEDEQYALALGREWGVGDEEKDNGVILLLSMAERSLRIEVGYGLEGALPDGKCGRIMDEYIIPYFSDDSYSFGIKTGFDQIAYEVCKEYAINVPDGVSAAEMPEEDDGWTWVVIAIILLVIIFSSFGKNTPTHRGGGVFYPGGFYGGFRGGGFGGSSGGGFRGGGGSFGGGGSSRKF